MNIPVYTTARIHAGINRSYCMTEKLSSSVRYLEKQEPMTLEDFHIESFEVPHDGTDNVGYCIEIDGKVFSFLTDLGEITPTAADYISKHWPYPILFFTNNVGGLLVCGAGLQQVDTERKDIVNRALYAFGTDTGRLAWDPFGVWCAGYACGKINRLGFKRVNIFIDTETGRNTFADATDGKHYVIYPLCNNKNYYNAMMDHLLIKKAKL